MGGRVTGMESVPRSYDSAVGVSVSGLDFLFFIFFLVALVFTFHGLTCHLPRA